jgi:hypothetical protein
MRAAALILLWGMATLGGAENLIDDPSFEQPKDRDKWGLVFSKWSGWKFEGDCSFEVGSVAHSGSHSALLAGHSAPKIRLRSADIELAQGRYRITAFLRGLDIGVGSYGQSIELAFDSKFLPMRKNGTFGWSKLTYVAELKEAKKLKGVSFGLLAPGFLWIDDVSLEKVPDETPVTETPQIASDESPISMPGGIDEGFVHCKVCGYRNMPSWGACYACGEKSITGPRSADRPLVTSITSFEEAKSPFSGDVRIEADHATDGTHALRVATGGALLYGPMNWEGFDLMKIDFFTSSDDPVSLQVEFSDKGSREYWTRVNYETVIPPGASTLVIPLRGLFVGEKSRPGRALDTKNIARFVVSKLVASDKPLYMDNVRLVIDESIEKARFSGLLAFDFGTSTSPVMDGFAQVTSGTVYSKGRGYGLKNAKIWRAFDVLQPDPLYQDYICIESGGFAVDVPDGEYHVVVNWDNPSGYWGEYQTFTERSIQAQGKEAVVDRMDIASFTKKYFRFCGSEDSMSDDTFDKYQREYFRERQFDAVVSNGQLDIGFSGQRWACSVASIIIYPKSREKEGEVFLKAVEDKRRFYFDSYFKRAAHKPTGDRLEPTPADHERGFVVFTRDYMKDIYENDLPSADEIGKPVRGEAFAGEYEPLTFAIVPLVGLGKVTVSVGDLTCEGSSIPASSIDTYFVSYRLSRVNMEGSINAIKPRLLIPSDSVEVKKNVTRRFWFTVRTPKDARAGLYKGTIAVMAGNGAAARVPIEFRVHAGELAEMDVPAGPWGHTISLPWAGPEGRAWEEAIAVKSLRRLRDYGFTTCTGLPRMTYLGFQDGKPMIDFTEGDAQMKRAKEAGFSMPVVSYCEFRNLNLYYQDTEQMKKAGFSDYSEFIKAVFTAVQRHADSNDWLPVYYNLGDEPMGDKLVAAAENAEAYRKAFPQGPPFFTAASSYGGKDANDPHFRLGKALHVADWNLHTEESIALLHAQGSDWANYNGGNRWTFGAYMFKAAKEFNMKFRVSWHWNNAAGDPYYALDCREDDYAWCNSTPAGDLVPSIVFEHLREGIDDYRYLLTLSRLAKAKAGTPAAVAADKLISERLAAFKLGQKDHDALFGIDDWSMFKHASAEAIDALRK